MSKEAIVAGPERFFKYFGHYHLLCYIRTALLLDPNHYLRPVQPHYIYICCKKNNTLTLKYFQKPILDVGTIDNANYKTIHLEKCNTKIIIQPLIGNVRKVIFALRVRTLLVTVVYIFYIKEKQADFIDYGTTISP